MKSPALDRARQYLGVVIGAGALSLSLTACRYDGTGTKMQWAPDMADAPTSKPQKSYLDPPEGAVAMTALFYPPTPELAEQALVMPEWVGKDPAAAEKGQQLYDTFCTICHGADAKGGPRVHQMIQPPDLTNAVYLNRGDGFFFYRITFGTSVMPGYGHAISAHERWYIVKHLRKLQKGQ